jgi:antitoxin MazE
MNGGKIMTVTQLTKWGNSQGIRINKETLKLLNFDSKEIENQEIKFEIEIQNGKIILNPIKEMTKLDKLFVGFEEDAEDYKVSIDWGNSVGKEVW